MDFLFNQGKSIFLIISGVLAIVVLLAINSIIQPSSVLLDSAGALGANLDVIFLKSLKNIIKEEKISIGKFIKVFISHLFREANTIVDSITNMTVKKGVIMSWIMKMRFILK